MMKFLHVVTCGAGVLVAYAMMDTGGLWDVLGIALFVCAVDLMLEWTT